MSIPTNTDWLDLPKAWAAFWPIISNPFTFGILISIAMEQLGWIKDPKVGNAKKLLAVFGACLVWSVFVALGSPSFTLSWPTAYTIVIMAVGVTASSQVGYLLISSIPWLQQILSVLFPKPSTTIIQKLEVTGTAASGAAVQESVIQQSTGEMKLPVS